MAKTKNNTQLSSKELEEQLKFQGRKLGALIKNSTLPQDVARELVELVPYMNLEQIERLINILEAKYLDEQTRDVDQQYKQRIKEVAEEYKKKHQEAENNLLKQLQKIEDSF